MRTITFAIAVLHNEAIETMMETTNRNFTFTFNATPFQWKRPLVMGILNLTNDSFFDVSRVADLDDLMRRGRAMLLHEADILDIGAQSTRPGAQRISARDEAEKLIPAIKALRKEFPAAILSADTFYASVAEKAADAGASMINDVSAGSIDKDMFSTMAQLKIPYVLMHMQGEPGTMHHAPHYENVVNELDSFFSEKISRLKDLGLQDIILDPGFGFGKTTEHNLALLKDLHHFTRFELPILAGLSRKKTIQNILNVTAHEALNGTTAMNTLALVNGASLLRVHDVAEAVQSVKLYCSLAVC